MIKGYYFITDSRLSRAGNTQDVINAVQAGVTVVQYRAKDLDSLFLYEEAIALRNICKDILFIVNDRIDIALAVHADGVHLGQTDMPLHVARKLMGKKKIIGVTVHNEQEALDAQQNGANYLGLSPVFSTNTKDDAGKPCGIAMLEKIKTLCRIPVVAIGGIDLTNARQVVRAGADALCAISAVVTNHDVVGVIREFRELFKN